MPDPRPNIVLIMADQLGAASLGCYGSGVPSSPALDRLASQGMRFDRFYAHVPLCSPNRATFLTGRSAPIHGIVSNNLEYQPHMPTYAGLLRQAGYRTGGFGKFHHRSQSLPVETDLSSIGFDESRVTEDSRMGPWLDWVREARPDLFETALATVRGMGEFDVSTPERQAFKDAQVVARKRVFEPIEAAAEWKPMYTSPLPKEIHQSVYITDSGLDFMKRHIAGSPERPFFCYVSYVDPHEPHDPPKPYDAMFRPEDMLPPIPMDGDAFECSILERSRDVFGFRAKSNDVDFIKRFRAMYHGEIRFIDDQIGRLLAFLDERGLAENTIVAFTTDHGEMLGDHGLITKGVKHYDRGIRCPMIVRGPGVAVGASDRLMSSLDFFPTVCDWAGIEDRPPLEGKSFAPACRGGESGDDWGAVTVMMLKMPGRHARDGVYSIVTDDGWRLTIFDEDGQGEMFNLFEDPDERKNLYGDRKWMDKRLELHERLTRAYMQPNYLPRYCNLIRR